MSGSLTETLASDSGRSSSDGDTNVSSPTFVGTVAAGDGVSVSITDASNTTSDSGTATVDGNGNWSYTTGMPLADGTYQVTATDPTASTSTSITVTIDTTAPAAPGVPTLDPGSDSGVKGDDITNVSKPVLTGTAEANSTVTLLDGNTVIGTTTADGSGSYSVTATTALSQGTNDLAVAATDAAGNTSMPSGTLAVTLDTTTPDTPYTPVLSPASDSGYKDDDITNVTTPTVTGTATAGDSITLYVDGSAAGTTTVASDGTWSLAVTTPLADGTHAISASQTDVAGNVSYQPGPLNLTIDTTPPAMPAAPTLAPSSDSGVQGDGITNVAMPVLTGTAEANSIVRLYDGGAVIGTTVAGSDGSFSVTATTALSQGANGLSVTATDAAGNTSLTSGTLTVTLDTTPPPAPTGLALTATSDSGFSNTDDLTNVTLPTLTGTAEPNSTVTLLDGGVAIGTAVTSASGSFSVTAATALSQGANGLSVTATDTVGNTSAASGTLSVTLDTTPPAAPTGLALTAASDSGISSTDDVTNVAMPSFTGTAEANSWVGVVELTGGGGYTVIAAGFANAAGTFTATPHSALTEGSNALVAFAVDPAGNISASSGALTVTLDTVAPVAPVGLALAPGSDSGLTGDDVTNVALPVLTGTAEANSTVRLYDGGAVIGTAVAGGNGSYSVTATTALAQGVNGLSVTATDAAGNTSMASGTLAVTLDTTPPAAPTGLALTAASDSGVRGDGITNVALPTLTGTAEAGSTVTLLDGGVAIGGAVTGASGSFSVTAATALAQGVNDLSVTATDAAGNTSAASGTLAVTLSGVGPAAPTGLALTPASDSGAAGDGLTNVALPSVTGTAAAGSIVTLYDGAKAIGTAVADGSGAFSVAAATALAEGANLLTATATDVAGNASAASAPLSIALDTSAPAATAVIQTDASGLTGSAEPGSTVLIGDGTTPLASVTAAANGSWAFLPSTLAAGTYDLSVTVEDAAGNLSAPAAGPVATVAADGSFSLSTTDASGLTTVSRYSAQDVLQPGNATTLTPSDGHSTISASATGNDVINSRGTDSIQAGGGTNLVFASGAAATVSGGAGNLVFVAGAGNYVAGGGAGTNTLYGGSGNNTLIGGGAAGSILVAGTGNASLVGGAGSAALMFGGPGSNSFTGSAGGGDIMVGGSGANSFALTDHAVAFGGPDGSDSFGTGTGSSLVVEGNGTEHVSLGGGNATLFGGAGADTYTVTQGLGGSAAIIGFKAGDHIALTGGFTAADAAQAVATATHGSFGTSLQLGDGTTITLFGATLTGGQVSAG